MIQYMGYTVEKSALDGYWLEWSWDYEGACNWLWFSSWDALTAYIARNNG